MELIYKTVKLNKIIDANLRLLFLQNNADLYKKMTNIFNDSMFDSVNSSLIFQISNEIKTYVART